MSWGEPGEAGKGNMQKGKESVRVYVVSTGISGEAQGMCRAMEESSGSRVGPRHFLRVVESWSGDTRCGLCPAQVMIN